MKGQETLFSSKTTSWGTPKDLFDKLNRIYNFSFDLAASEENALCQQFFTAEQNSLVQDWTDVVGWLNPPYDKCKEFVAKCMAEDEKAKLVCLLVPARTDTKWFQSLPFGTWVFFFRGRLKFGQAGNSAPFPSCLVFFGKDSYMARELAGKDIPSSSGRWVVF